MKRLPLHLLLGLTLAARLASPVCAQEKTEVEIERAIEAPSPDGRFAFLHTVTPKAKTFDLIEQATGKVLLRAAASDENFGDRLSASVLWRPDSKGFALTVMIVRLETQVSVYVRRGASFREIELPALVVEIPRKLTRGKDLPHIAALNSQRALRWRKNGALVVQIAEMVDGSSGSVTATRTVVLGFRRPGRAEILQSTIKFATETPEDG